MNEVIQGDCLEVLKTLSDNSVDSLVTDPPAGIAFMSRSWDKDKGGMIQWINWMSEVMSESLRVMKPGACGLVWSIPRTCGWTQMAIELAGFRVIDVVHHVSGSGFPKAQDIGRQTNSEWNGWKTPALKPAVEGWFLIQKPISEGSIARNILKHGVGGLNIESCRVGTGKDRSSGGLAKNASMFQAGLQVLRPSGGRYPANLILSCGVDCKGDRHSDDCPIELLNRQTDGTRASKSANAGSRKNCKAIWGHAAGIDTEGYDDGGNGNNAARYFKQLSFDPETIASVYYQTKASKRDRTLNGAVANVHPTVKSMPLMQYLVRLVTPPGGITLDPFGGSGTTALACLEEGFNYLLIEREPEYIEIINARIAAWHEQRQPVIPKIEPIDQLSLFTA